MRRLASTHLDPGLISMNCSKLSFCSAVFFKRKYIPVAFSVAQYKCHLPEGSSFFKKSVQQISVSFMISVKKLSTSCNNNHCSAPSAGIAKLLRADVLLLCNLNNSNSKWYKDMTFQKLKKYNSMPRLLSVKVKS